MMRGFRHTLFLCLQIGVLLSGLAAVAVQPSAWQPIGLCVAGSLLASLICDRMARRYLRTTLGGLRRAADDLGCGRQTTTIEATPGDDFYKLVSAINAVALRLAKASNEEHRLNDELRRRERLAFLGELAASVAHEVNNPLDGIQNCSRILRRCLDDPKRAAQMLDLMDNGLLRIDTIVRRLLTLAREHVIRPVDARIGDVVDSAASAVADKLAAAAVQLEVTRETENDVAAIDAQLLEQVFVNLFANAVDSMPTGGVLRVAIRRESIAPTGPTAAAAMPVVCVEVADTGLGISPDVLPHIFEPFFTTKQGGRGTGLGLSIAARIVEAHRGAVSVNPREGGGTVFAVRIPAREARIEDRVRSGGADHRAAILPGEGLVQQPVH